MINKKQEIRNKRTCNIKSVLEYGMNGKANFNEEQSGMMPWIFQTRDGSVQCCGNGIIRLLYMQTGMDQVWVGGRI